jgi:hypothetical protein
MTRRGNMSKRSVQQGELRERGNVAELGAVHETMV